MARKFCPVGKVIQGVHVVILGDDGKPLPVGCSGEVSGFFYIDFKSLFSAAGEKPVTCTVKALAKFSAWP